MNSQSAIHPVASVSYPVVDSGGFVWGFFGFIFCALVFPLILFFRWKNQTPLKARAMLIGYLIGLIVCIILAVVLGLILFANLEAIAEWLDEWLAEQAAVIIVSFRGCRE